MLPVGPLLRQSISLKAEWNNAFSPFPFFSFPYFALGAPGVQQMPATCILLPPEPTRRHSRLPQDLSYPQQQPLLLWNTGKVWQTLVQISH